MASPAVPDPRRFPIPASFETPRLLLRPFAVPDAPQLHEALVESIDALREHLWFLPWVAEPPTWAAAEARCLQAQADFLQRADLPYLAFERRSGRLVASAGLHRTDWALPATEVGSRAVALRCGFRLEGVLRHAARSIPAPAAWPGAS